MKHYVLGFVFSGDLSQVLLVKKIKPAPQKGLWNGIGGKIESNETPIEAMRRESKEETGYERNFEHCLTFMCSGGTVFVYKDRSAMFIVYKQIEEEQLGIWPVHDLPISIMVGNLRWIIPFCLSETNMPIIINENY